MGAVRKLVVLSALATAALAAGACVSREEARDSAMTTTQSKGIIDTSATPNVPDSTTGVSGRTGRAGVAGDTLAGRRRTPPPPEP